MNNYSKIIEDKFSDIINRYGLVLAVKNQNETFLLGKIYAISIFIRRDELSIIYIDIASKNKFTEYDLGLFMVSKRFSPSDFGEKKEYSDHNELIAEALNRYSKKLLQYCDDILVGDKEWLKSYPWNSSAVAEDTKLFLLNNIGK
ncbi:MAG: hypothetical protein ED859_03145 [Desulfuromonadales bacterium]|nr:MAG: hypothetical protein ED859_03145 [Desulfuromonadales bacterium]